MEQRPADAYRERDDMCYEPDTDRHEPRAFVVHATRPVAVWADVDEGIADTVTALQAIPGVRTHASCQGTIGDGGAEPYSPFVMVTWNGVAALGRLQQDFDLDIEGESWGYVHPKAQQRSDP